MLGEEIEKTPYLKRLASFRPTTATTLESKLRFLVQRRNETTPTIDIDAARTVKMPVRPDSHRSVRYGILSLNGVC